MILWPRASSGLCNCLEMEEAASFTSHLLAVILLLAWFMSKEREIICIYLPNTILMSFLPSEILWYYQISHILKLTSTRPNQTRQFLFLEITPDSPPSVGQLHHLYRGLGILTPQTSSPGPLQSPLFTECWYFLRVTWFSFLMPTLIHCRE